MLVAREKPYNTGRITMKRLLCMFAAAAPAGTQLSPLGNACRVRDPRRTGLRPALLPARQRLWQVRHMQPTADNTWLYSTAFLCTNAQMVYNQVFVLWL